MITWDELLAVHKGDTGLIIGNGPSLKDVPLDLLRKYPTFGTNRIYLLGDFTPTYYVSVNPLVIEQSKEQIKGINAIKFVPDRFVSDIPGALGLTSHYQPTFSYNPAAYIYEGYTVTYVCMQIAYWMDFDNILLVGVDHRFTYQGDPNQQVVSEGADPNHFHPDYFGKGVTWNNPDLERSAQAYELAKTAFESDSKRIINLTAGTALDVFEKGNMENYL